MSARFFDSRYLMVVSLALAGVALARAGAAQLREPIRISPDIALSLNEFIALPQAVTEDDLRGGLRAVDLGELLPAEVRITAYYAAKTGLHVFSVDRAVVLPGDVVALPGEVVAYRNGEFEILLGRDRLGLSPGVVVDALSFLANGNLVFSCDTSVMVDGVVADDEDLLEIGPDPVRLFFDGSAAGIPSRLDVDGVYVREDGRLLLSFDASGSIGAVTFDDEDVLTHDPRGGTWEMAYDASAAYDEWQAGDLSALSLVPAELCTGDCDEDGQVTSSELVRGVAIALGTQSLGACASTDADGDDAVEIDELIRAVENALNGCA
jgi:hypothetical protein